MRRMLLKLVLHLLQSGHTLLYWCTHSWQEKRMCCKLFRPHSPRSEFLGMPKTCQTSSACTCTPPTIMQYPVQTVVRSAYTCAHTVNVHWWYSDTGMHFSPWDLLHILSCCLQLTSTQVNDACRPSCMYTKSTHSEPEHISNSVLLQLGGCGYTPCGQVTRELLCEGYFWREHTWSSSQNLHSWLECYWQCMQTAVTRSLGIPVDWRTGERKPEPTSPPSSLSDCQNLCKYIQGCIGVLYNWELQHN